MSLLSTLSSFIYIIHDSNESSDRSELSSIVKIHDYLQEMTFRKTITDYLATFDELQPQSKLNKIPTRRRLRARYWAKYMIEEFICNPFFMSYKLYSDLISSMLHEYMDHRWNQKARNYLT